MSELNRVITSLIIRSVPSKVIRRKVNDKAWFNKDYINASELNQGLFYLTLALHLTLLSGSSI